MRHGPAKDRDPRRWPDDTARPLSREGVAATRAAARGFAAAVGKVDEIASSPLARARSTAELLAEAYPRPPRLVLWEELASGALAAPILERLADRPGHREERLVVVGHEPTLGALLGLALTGEPVPFARLAKAGAAALSFPRRVAPGGAQLDWLATRKQLTSWGRPPSERAGRARPASGRVRARRARRAAPRSA